MLVSGAFSYTEIETHYEDTDFPVPRRSASHHAKECLGYEDEAIRRMIERHAQERGVDIEKATTNLLQHKTYLELTVQKAFEGLVTGNVVPDSKDAFKAIEILDKIDEKGINWTIERMKSQNEALKQAIREIVPDHLITQIVERTHQIYEGAIVPGSESSNRAGNLALPNPDAVSDVGKESDVPGSVVD